MKNLILVLIAPLLMFLYQNSLGTLTDQNDIGNPLHAGRAMYNAANDEYTIEGAGANIWANRDEFHFVWRRLQGNFILNANAGLSARESNRTEKSDGWCAPVWPTTHHTVRSRFTATVLHHCSSAKQKAPLLRK